MILQYLIASNLFLGVLHVSGGDPSCARRDPLFFVFSTYVEMILLNRLKFRDVSSILHVSGGDPIPLTWLMK